MIWSLASSCQDLHIPTSEYIYIDSTIETPEAFQSIALAGYGHDHCLGRCTALERSSTIAAGGHRFFFWRRWDDFGKEGRFLGWKLNATKVIMVYNGYYINYGYNGLQWL